jgi:hypothetical protein
MNLGEGLVEIEEDAFALCRLLQHIDLPLGVKVNRVGVLNECASKSTVNLGEELEEIENAV